MKIIVRILPVLLLLVGCQRQPKNSHPLIGQYQLVAHDHDGRLMFTGSMDLVSIEQSYLEGRCTVVREKDAPQGLFDQKGNCAALIDGKKVEFDFAPGLDDAGLLLEGEFEAGRMSGIWRLDGFATSEPLGRFEAIKKPQ